MTADTYGILPPTPVCDKAPDITGPPSRESNTLLPDSVT